MSPEPTAPLSASQIEALSADAAATAVQACLTEQRIDVLTALATSAKKPLAKLAKKALYQLKSSGVAVPETKAVAPSAPRAPTAGTEELPAVLSAIIGTGERAMLFGRTLKGGHGLESFQCVLSDTLGLLDFRREETSRGDYKRHLKAIRQQPQGSIEVPYSRALEELQHALFLHQRAGTLLPSDDAESLVRRLGLTPKERVLPMLTADAQAAPSDAQTLHREREIATWLPPEPLIRVLLHRLEEVRASPLQLTETQRVAQTRLKLEQTAQEYATPEIAALYARRLLNMAEIFEATGRATTASTARSEALHIQSSAPNKPAPFFVALFEKVLQLAAAGAAQQGAGDVPQPVAPTERRSPGGLILP